MRNLTEIKLVFAVCSFLASTALLFIGKLSGSEWVAFGAIIVPAFFAVTYLDQRNKRKYDSE